MMPSKEFPVVRRSQVSYLIGPVLCNLLLSLSAWVFIYNAEPAPQGSTSIALLNSDGKWTTGSDIVDGMLNSMMCLFMLAGMSFVLLTIALHNFKMVIQAYLTISCIAIIFFVPANFFKDLLEAFSLSPCPTVVVVLSMCYGITGLFAFFHPQAPLVLHQFYVICNCSMVSLCYIRNCPKYTLWFILLLVIFWDTFAVLAPNGPLRKAQEKAGDYQAWILRLLMFTAEEEKKSNAPIIDDTRTDSSSYDTDDDCKTAREIPRRQTAEDALNDPHAVRLGMGDFVFYSLLVCKAASSGSVFGTVAAIAGVLIGLIATLTLSNGEETAPALSLSIGIGMGMHFATIYLLQPMINTGYHSLFSR